MVNPRNPIANKFTPLLWAVTLKFGDGIKDGEGLFLIILRYLV